MVFFLFLFREHAKALRLIASEEKAFCMVTKITVGALGNWHNIGNCLSYSPLSYFKCQQNFEIQWPRTNGKIMLPTKFLCQQVMFATLHVAFCSRRLAYVSMWLCGTTARLQQRKLLEYTKTYFLNHAQHVVIFEPVLPLHDSIECGQDFFYLLPGVTNFQKNGFSKIPWQTNMTHGLKNLIKALTRF
jgi:hypothetical protein